MVLNEVNDDDIGLIQIGTAFSVITLIAVLLNWFFRSAWDKKKRLTSQSSQDSDKLDQAGENEEKPNPFRKKQKDFWRKDRNRDIRYHHPWLQTTLKGHLGRVLDIDFSSNGKFLVSVCSDRTLFLWNNKDFSEKEHKFARCAIEYDHATKVAFAPDSKSIIVSFGYGNRLAAFKISRKEGSHGYKCEEVENVKFPSTHNSDINNIGVASNGKYLMSSSDDNKVVMYTLRGEVIKSLEPKLNILHCASISPCSRFLATSGFTPDVFIHEVSIDRNGCVQNVKRAFDLKGHSSGVYSFSFNQDSSRCITASKDGTWKLFNTDIRYNQGEESKVIASGSWDVLRNASSDSVFVAMSPSGNSCVIGASRHLHLICTLQPGKVFDTILDAHQEPLSRVRMSSCGKFFATSGDRHIHIFHNVAEYYGYVVSLENALQKARDDASRRRFNEQLTDAKKNLESVLNKQ